MRVDWFATISGSSGLGLTILGFVRVFGHQTGEGITSELSALVPITAVSIVHTEEGVGILSGKVFCNGKGILIGLVRICF